MPVAGFTCSDFARVFLSFAREAMGCGLRNPAFPAPSVLRDVSYTTRAFCAARPRSRGCLTLSCRPGLDPGPITTKAWVARSWGRRSLKNRHLWLWVPACAGTTNRVAGRYGLAARRFYCRVGGRLGQIGLDLSRICLTLGHHRPTLDCSIPWGIRCDLVEARWGLDGC